ncbi:hypothetical protein A3F06_01090 [candidate division TM6 bacterium RIFCSPHIGHO2_12_FULL_36_22]|nr:MAG: hypothetical protein A3F06_01090 [candidate division TM6 bacterium RIFCSPHIGHO2_12_FULL_36_22]
MFSKMLHKVSQFEDHHQALFAIVIAIGVVFFSWGIEKLLEHHIFVKHPLFGYVFSIVFGVFLLWMTKVVVLNLM